jgi:hypothetical protein
VAADPGGALAAVTTMLLGLACGAVLRLTHDAELQRLLE